MNVYLAGRYEERRWMRGIAEKIERHHFRVVSRWHHQDEEEVDDFLGAEAAQYAEMDRNDVLGADVFIHITDGDDDARSQTGAHVELGMALVNARPTEIILIGDPTCVFHGLSDDVRYYADWESFHKEWLHEGDADARDEADSKSPTGEGRRTEG